MACNKFQKAENLEPTQPPKTAQNTKKLRNLMKNLDSMKKKCICTFCSKWTSSCNQQNWFLLSKIVTIYCNNMKQIGVNSRATGHFAKVLQCSDKIIKRFKK